MRNKIIFAICISILVVLSILIYLSPILNDGGLQMEDEEVYQGPVPEGYDEEHFRKTGITKPLGSE